MWKQLTQPSDAIRYFHPGWFASVMGTGILAVATAHTAPFIPAVKGLAVGLWAFNALLCLVLLVPWMARWLFFFSEAWADLSHPIRGPFYSTLPIGLLVLSVDFSAIGRQVIGAGLAVPIAQGLWIAGALLAFFFGVLIPYKWFTSHSIPAEQTNGGWFMPPVANIVVPASAAPLIATWGSPDLCYFMCLVAFAFLGIGFFLFLIVGVLLIGRLIYNPLPHAHLAPTLWIGLGPIGVGSLALVRLSTTASPIFGELVSEAQVFLRLASLSLWGFGVWWLVTAIVLTLRYLREPFPFAMSWWAFTFPLGAYTVATYLLADAYRVAVLGILGVVLWLLLLFLWAVVLVRTAIGTYTGTLLQAPVPAPSSR